MYRRPAAPVLRVLACQAVAAFAAAAAPANAEDAMPVVSIIGTREVAQSLAGAADLIDAQALERTQAFTANEALRKAPGVNVRDEEGFGLRPNIGIRGLNPTRSTKVTLLEDGLPLAYAPYGDNASYFHPPIERFDRIEVLKGANSLAFGPQTIGGVVNYLTPEVPEAFGGHVQLGGGSRDYATAHLRVGGGGLLADFIHKKGDGARQNNTHAIDDLNLKYAQALGDTHALQLRLNAYREDSLVTYSGLTQAEYERLGARHNPFRNDGFETTRRGASLTHRWTPRAALQVTTSAYYSSFDRDWWRQSSASQDPQCGAAFNARRLAGLAVDVESCASVQGRLRNYALYGVEPRLQWQHGLGELQLGAKLHVEEQDRRQVNGTAPRARTGTLVESNLRDTRAMAAFVANRFELGRLEVTPILRHEHISADRRNRLNGTRGSTTLARTLPGLGLAWRATDGISAFAGIHAGFAPPRVEDLIAGGGTVTEVDAEESTNVELGLRGEAFPGLRFQLAWFHNDFENLIAVGSIAGGATPLSQGKALFSGLELGATLDLTGGLYGAAALTWLDEARQVTAFRSVANGALVGVAGNRQPYAPEYTATLTLGYAAGPLSVQAELQHLSAQFADFANTVAPSADGQRGILPAQTVLGVTANYAFGDRWSTFVAVKNLADRTYIVDRTRGILVGQPRLVQAGVRVNF